MSGATERQWADQLLAGMGGQPCRDADTGVGGVWLPRRAWDNLAAISRGSPMAHGYALAGQHAVRDAYEQTERLAECTDAASDPLET
ncbi:MAG TPA: hypothetical protein VFF26_06660 [Gallionella sp.]|nr:hypothetical protein [Gallionella sp.]